MRTCHACQGEISDDDLLKGICPHCQAVIQKVAKRTLRLPEGLSPDTTIDLTGAQEPPIDLNPLRGESVDSADPPSPTEEKSAGAGADDLEISNIDFDDLDESEIGGIGARSTDDALPTFDSSDPESLDLSDLDFDDHSAPSPPSPPAEENLPSPPTVSDVEAGSQQPADAKESEPDESHRTFMPVRPGTLDDSEDQTIDLSAVEAAALRGLENKKRNKRSTHQIDSDLTVDLGGVDPVLADRLSREWRGTCELSTPLNQTIRQKDSISGFRSSLPIKPRSLKQSPADGSRPRYITPSDAPDYELLDVIGEGGMGVVYAAHQSSIARTVAVKMLKSNAKASDDQRDKFISEAVVTGELDHPNIVPIYDLGANDEGALFYSMKKVRGTPWETTLPTMSRSENLQILMRVADALAFAHANGVIHRDLKPENVMVGDFGEVLLMDWGLARVTAEFPSASSIYQTASLGGTPAYMAPEMARGPVEVIDHTSDIYLLGAILYEIIGGRPPHSGRDVMQCLMAAAHNRIDPIDERGELYEIAMKAMATEQHDRYQSVKEMQQAIRDYQSHAESLLLTEHADRNYGEAKEKRDYQLYARSLYGYQESLTLWPGNERAQRQLGAAKLDYARTALEEDNLELALSLLEPDKPEHQELLNQVHAAQRERVARANRLKWARRMVAGLIALVIVGGGVFSYFLNQQRHIALIAKGEAEESEKEAIRQAGIAQENAEEAERRRAEAVASEERARAAEGVAKAEAENAREAEKVARDAQQEAEKQREAALLARNEALEAKTAADVARTNEEYQSYISRIGLADAKIDENAYGFAVELLDDLASAGVDRRNWEWGRLRYLSELSSSVHDSPAEVDSVAVSLDGTRIASGDRTGTVTIRDATTGEVTQSVVIGQGLNLYGLDFSPDSKQLAVAASDGKIRLLDVATGNISGQLEGHTSGVSHVDYSPGGRFLVSSSFDDTARIWEVATGRLMQTLQGHTWWVWSAQYDTSGRRIVTAGQDGRAIVWQINADGNRFEQQGTFLGHRGPVFSAAFSTDGDLVASGGFDKSICLWKPRDVQQIKLENELSDQGLRQDYYVRLTGHEAAVRSVTFAAGKPLLLTGSHDNTLRLWSTTDGKLLKTIRGHGKRVEEAVLAPNAAFAVSASQDQSVRVWDVARYTESHILGARQLAGHADAILGAHFSPDGSAVVTASRDRSARMWDADTGKLMASFEEGHDFLTSSAVFYDSGRRLATAAGDGTVRLWDVMTGGEEQVIAGTGLQAALAVAPQGDWLVTGGPAGQAQVFHVASGKRLAELGESSQEGGDLDLVDEVTSVGIAPDGQLIAVGSERGVVSLWNKGADGFRLVAPLRGHVERITALRFAPDGSRLYAASGDRSVSQWDLATHNADNQLSLRHDDWVESLDVSSDGRFAVTACDDGGIRVWELATATTVAEASFDFEVTIYDPTDEQNQAKRQRAKASSVAFSPDGSQVVVTSSNGKGVWLWDWSSAQAAGRKSSLTENGDGNFVRRVTTASAEGLLWASQFAPDGNRLVTVGGNKAEIVQLDGTIVMEFSPHGAVSTVALSPDGTTLATGSWDHSVKWWDAATGKRKGPRGVRGHADYINSLAFSPDGTRLATASDDKTVALWDVDSCQLLPLRLVGHEGKVRSVEFSPDGALLLTASSDGTVRLWDATSGAQKVVFNDPERRHRLGVLCATFSPDGQFVASGGEGSLAKIWNIDGTWVRDISGHTAGIASIAYSPDGTRLLTGSLDTTAKLWDPASGKEILTLPGHEQDITSVEFSQDGRTILTASRDGTAILWPAVDWRTEVPPLERQMVGR